MLRVIAGKYRGRKINQPPLSITRPTMDRVKEAIFNIIQFDIKGSLVLDLFAGSGSLSIESVSREATKAIAIDSSEAAVKIMNQNLAKLKINNIEVHKLNVIDYLRSSSGKKFDFIFMDPPFANYKIYETTLELISEMNILKNNGLIILETKDWEKIKIPRKLTIHKQKKYGISHVLLIANNI